MGYIEGHSRDQMLLLPVSFADYVAADNPVRFIAAFVDDLDLGELGFDRSRPKATGRPGYDPAEAYIANLADLGETVDTIDSDPVDKGIKLWEQGLRNMSDRRKMVTPAQLRLTG